MPKKYDKMSDKEKMMEYGHMMPDMMKESKKKKRKKK